MQTQSSPAASAALFASADPFAALRNAERFIAGFEDDASQSGVTRLLADLRQAQAQALLTPRLDIRSEYDNHRIDMRSQDKKMSMTLYPGNNQHQPGKWWGFDRRTDQAGREWSSRALFVTDDFGDLVEVPA